MYLPIHIKPSNIRRKTHTTGSFLFPTYFEELIHQLSRISFFSKTTLIWVHIPHTYIGLLEIPFILGIIIRIFSGDHLKHIMGTFLWGSSKIFLGIWPPETSKNHGTSNQPLKWLLMSCMIYDWHLFVMYDWKLVTIVWPSGLPLGGTPGTPIPLVIGWIPTVSVD
jgi:hypothetical protein